MALLFRFIVLVLSVLAWVGFSALVRFRSRSFSRLPCSFLLAVLLPVRVPSGFLFRCRPFGLSGGGVPPVVLAISFCWALPCGGGGVRGGVVVCFLPLSFFLPKGGGWGWLGWLFYYQI